MTLLGWECAQCGQQYKRLFRDESAPDKCVKCGCTLMLRVEPTHGVHTLDLYPERSHPQDLQKGSRDEQREEDESPSVPDEWIMKAPAEIPVTFGSNQIWTEYVGLSAPLEQIILEVIL